MAVYPVSAWLAPDLIVEQGKKIIALTNEVRSNLKLELLAESEQLNEAASAKVQDMLLNQYFDHISPTQKGLAYWLDKIKYDYSAAGENLAMGFSDAPEVIEGWKRSKTHYANMIDPDFKEVGAGAVGGDYQGIDTIFVAQFFGAPKTLITPPAVSATETNNAESSVIDANNAKLTIIDPVGQKEKVISATAFLGEEAVKAEVIFGDYRMALNKEEGGNKWSGRTVIYEEDAARILNPVVPANLSITDRAGTTRAVDISWENVKPVKPSFLDQYFFLKSYQAKYAKPLLGLSSIYYQFILIVLLIAFLLNIFIEIRKQHPRIILLSLGMIALFAFLLVV